MKDPNVPKDMINLIGKLFSDSKYNFKLFIFAIEI
jgi:hypothetical protein